MHGVPGRNNHTAATVGRSSHTAASRNSHAAAIAETAKLQRGLIGRGSHRSLAEAASLQVQSGAADGFRPQQPPFFNQNFHSGSLYFASLVLQKDAFLQTILKPLFLHTLSNPHPGDAASHLTKTPHGADQLQSDSSCTIGTLTKPTYPLHLFDSVPLPKQQCQQWPKQPTKDRATLLTISFK